MNIYIHEGKGHYIGSAIVVVADNFDVAKAVIRNKLDNNGLEKEIMDIVCIGPVEMNRNSVVYSNDGNY